MVPLHSGSKKGSAHMLVFLFTDIERSIRLWEEHTSVMTGVIARHDEILREQVEGHGGRITRHTGDGVTATCLQPGRRDAGDGRPGATQAMGPKHRSGASHLSGPYCLGRWSCLQPRWNPAGFFGLRRHNPRVHARR